MLDRLRRWLFGGQDAREAEGLHRAGPAAVAARAGGEVVEGVLACSEVDCADFFIGALFRRKFGGPPPEQGRHFVAFHRPDEAPETLRAVGYVHHAPFGDSYLGGGFVIDERAYRRMSREHRERLRRLGGISECLLRYSVDALSDATALWGYVGDARARKVDLRVGYRPVDHPHLVVIWNRPLPEGEKRRRIREVEAVGPF